MKTKEISHDHKIFETLLESVTDYVVAINKDYQIIMANDLFKNQFGVHPDDYCYKRWKKREERCEDCVVAKSFEDGQAHVTEETVVMQDGRLAQMRIRSVPVKDDRGRVTCVLQTATDITRKKDLEKDLNRPNGRLENALIQRLQDLQKSEEKYRTIFERSRDAILLTDARGKILEVNQAGIEMLGYERKREVLALPSAMDIFESRHELHELQKKLFGQGAVKEFEAAVVGKTGERFDALINSNVIVDASGQITGYVIMIRDITKRKKAREEIRNQNLRLVTLNSISMKVNSSLNLQEVLQGTMDQIIEILQPDSVRIYLLDRKTGVLNLVSHKGLSREFLDMDHVRFRDVGNGRLGQSVQLKTVQVIDNLVHSKDLYVNHLLKEGLRSTLYMPLMSKKEVVGAMCVSSHSPFRFSEDYVKFLESVGWQIGVAIHHAELFEQLKKAYQQLKQAQDQVVQSEKLASLGKLSATIAHEINNPIASVLTYVRLMSKMMGRGQFTEQRREDISRYLATMESEVKRCGDIVKNLLAFARQSELSIRPHGIEDIIDRALSILGHDLSMKEIRVVKDVDKGLPAIPCDFRQIQQVLLNLMSNASESMERNGTLSLRAERSDRDGFMEVSVSDTGCGIPPEHLKDIFEPFFTTKEEGKGVGLGLSVAYGIITRHGGHIHVKSEPGKGSTFTLFLPFESQGPLMQGGSHLGTENGSH